MAAGAAGAKPVDKAQIIAAIKAGEFQWNDDVAAKDVARFVSHYDDGMMAYTQDHCTETDQATHAKVANPCSYLTLYKREADGSWKAIADIASPAPK